MRRWNVVGVVLAAMAVAPAAASGATLVPLAPPESWQSSPIHATAPPGDPRLFVVERAGRVRIVKDGALQPTPFLTVPNVDTAGERGLLSMAFAPDYATSGLFYVFYTAAPGGAVRIVEYRRSASDPDLADPSSARLVLEQPHSASNHNGGQLAFGPDGLLYITIGDNANRANAQDLANLFGKVLRIDPRAAGPAAYTVPASNPFVATPSARGEIFALGLRNPYRASFAPNGALVVADVGEGTWEEVNAGDLKGKNLGWPTCEGACSSPNPLLTDPVFQYANGPNGCAIIGGVVVRDPALTGLTGRYLYGDLCRPDLRTLDLAVAGADPRPAGLSLPSGSLLGFGEDASGRVYVLTSDTAFRVVPDPVQPPPSPPARAVTRENAAHADVERPVLRLRSGRQRLRRYVQITATCSEACTLRARGVLRFPRRASSAAPIRLTPISRSARAGERVRLRLRLEGLGLRRARRASKARGRVFAVVRIVAADEAGNVARRRMHVPLVRY